MVIVAQISGVIGLLFLIVAMQNNDKEKVLKNQMFANVFYELQYIALGAFSGACMAAVGIIRSKVFSDYEQQKKPITVKVLVAVLMAIVVLGVFSYTSYYSIIPTVMTMLYSYAIWQKDLKKFRLLSLVSVTGWIYYNLSVGAYVAFIGSVIELSSIAVAIDKFDGNRK